MSVILLEGPDGGGKSTFAKTVLSTHVYQHNGPPPDAGIVEVFWWQLEGLLPKTLHPTVVDRSWPSEQIYHRFANRPHTFPPVIQRLFERVMFSMEGVVVVCLPPYEIAYPVWKERALAGKELLVADDDFGTMYDFYRGWKSTTSLPTVEYDYTFDEQSEIRHRIFEESCTLWPNKWSGLLSGNPGANILFVGDKCDEGWQLAGKPTLPFVDPVGPVRWFTHQLMLAGLSERQVAFTNAITPDGEWMDQAVVKDFSLVVALGAVAEEWVNKSGRWNGVINLPNIEYWYEHCRATPYPLHKHMTRLRDVATMEIK